MASLICRHRTIFACNLLEAACLLVQETFLDPRRRYLVSSFWTSAACTPIESWISCCWALGDKYCLPVLLVFMLACSETIQTGCCKGRWRSKSCFQDLHFHGLSVHGLTIYLDRIGTFPVDQDPITPKTTWYDDLDVVLDWSTVLCFGLFYESMGCSHLAVTTAFSPEE